MGKEGGRLGARTPLMSDEAGGLARSWPIRSKEPQAAGQERALVSVLCRSCCPASASAWMPMVSYSDHIAIASTTPHATPILEIKSNNFSRNNIPFCRSILQCRQRATPPAQARRSFQCAISSASPLVLALTGPPRHTRARAHATRARKQNDNFPRKNSAGFCLLIESRRTPP